MAIDWTQFFNPSAWGSFAPGHQGMINPQVQGAAGAPQPSGAIGPPPNPPASILGGSGTGGSSLGPTTGWTPSGSPATPPALGPTTGWTPSGSPGPSGQSALLSKIQSALGGGGGAPGYTGPTGNIGYGTGVGPTGPIPAVPPPNPPAGAATNPLGGSSQNWNNMMQKVGMSLLQPPAAQPQPIQMAKPVGPGQMPMQDPSAGNTPFGTMPGMLNRYGF